MSISERGVPQDWYAHAFDAGTTGLPWADRTEAEVDRVLEILDPGPQDRILDLACGTGRHSIALARRGFDVVGVDISSDLIEIAEGEAAIREVDAEFILTDLRNLDFSERFDRVLSLHGGAIGYFEDDAENRRAFEIVAAALRPGGAHLAQLPNALFAQAHLPQKTWAAGEQSVELLERDWDPATRYMEGEFTPILIDDFHFGLEPIPFRQRLYTVEELRAVYASLGMSLEAVLDEDGAPLEPSDAEEEIFVVARKG